MELGMSLDNLLFCWYFCSVHPMLL